MSLRHSTAAAGNGSRLQAERRRKKNEGILPRARGKSSIPADDVILQALDSSRFETLAAQRHYYGELPTVHHCAGEYSAS